MHKFHFFLGVAFSICLSLSSVRAMTSIDFSGGDIQNRHLRPLLEDSLARVNCDLLMSYGDSAGNDGLRKQIADLYGRSIDDVLVTSSSQQSLNLVFSHVLKTRKTVLVQEPTFFGVHRILRGMRGVRVIPFSSTQELLSLLEHETNAVVYLTSNFQSPTGVSLYPFQKEGIALKIKDTNSVLIEDNPYDFLDYTQQKNQLVVPSTIQKLLPERTFYISGFSKIFGPGVRTSYILVPVADFDAIRSLKITADLSTSALSQQVVMRMLSDVERLGLINKIKSEYKTKRNKALTALEMLLSDLPKVSFTRPMGGIFLQITFPDEIPVKALVKLAKERYGLVLDTNEYSYADGKARNSIRINFVKNTTDQLVQGLRRLVQAMKDSGITEFLEQTDAVDPVKTLEQTAKLREVIVTSGGTSVYIDDVRKIGNDSSGTTGAFIAEEFLRRGYRVHFVASHGSKRPFESELQIDPSKNINDELVRLHVAATKAKKLLQNLIVHEYKTFDQYYSLVERLCKANTAEAIILAAAVSDYGSKAENGKIRSDAEFLEFKLERLPKVISKIKQWSPKIFLVGFKLLSRLDLNKAIEVGHKSGVDNHSNLTVLNILKEGSFRDRVNVLITPEKGLIPVATKDVHQILVDTIATRVSQQHYKTEVDVDKSFSEKHAQSLQVFKYNIAQLWRYNIFEPYSEGGDKHFGFYAMRVPQGGFLITSRGSNKENITDDDIIYVSRVDFQSKIIYGSSTGRKASLNANIAAKIFETRPEINEIIHAHIFLGIQNKTNQSFAPSTEEDLQEVMRHLSGNETAVEMVNHGVILLGANFQEATAELRIEAAYNRFPDFYDAQYRRFQSSTAFIDLVRSEFERHDAILDLGAGTGEVTKALIESNFTNLSIADQSPGMLRVARSKFKKLFTAPKVHQFVTSFQDMNIGGPYDGIVLRQAINYFMSYEELVEGLKKIRQKLKSGGRLVFNAPSIKQNYPDRTSQYSFNDYDVRVHERNELQNAVLTHSQRTILFKKDGSEVKNLYDLNSFRLYTAEEFQRALKEAGFDTVQFYNKMQHRVDMPDPNDTIYVIAE